jgi:hypothetical protein
MIPRNLALPALVLALGACSSPTTGALFHPDGGYAGPTQPPAVALIWDVSPGATATATCSVLDDTFTIGNPETHVITSSGSSFNGLAVSASCTVTPNGTGYSVSGDVRYGSEGELTFSGQINVAAGATPGVQTGIHGSFVDGIHTGVTSTLADTNCTISFTANPYMGVAPGRIGAILDCPHAAGGGNVCEGHAEFVLESCAQ